MNIFNALSARRDKQLREKNLSAILAYFLDPSKEHGMGDAFLKAFLKYLRKFDNVNIDTDECFINTEHPINEEFLDIFISLPETDESGRGGEHHILIEVKIKSTSVQPERTQLKQYYDAYKDNIENNNNSPEINKRIIAVLIAPKDSKTSNEYNNLSCLRVGDDRVHLPWIAPKEDDSVCQIIQTILLEELQGEIAPINEYVKHTLKAFVFYLSNTPYVRPSSNSVEYLNYTIVKKQNFQYDLYKDGTKIAYGARGELIDIAVELNLEEKIKPSGTRQHPLNKYEIARHVFDELVKRQEK